MTIYRCDRCGKDVKFGNLVQVRVNGMLAAMAKVLEIPCMGELCKYCFEDLKDFMKRLPEISK